MKSCRNVKKTAKSVSNISRNGILLPKLFWPTVRKKNSSDQENLFKFKAEGREFGDH